MLFQKVRALSLHSQRKRSIPHVNKVLVVASGKGGVGKSTIAVNLAFALARLCVSPPGHRLRVGILDLDIFGPSIPTLMGLQNSDTPHTTTGAILPIVNHGIPTMSMGYLLPKTENRQSGDDPAIIWRGLMVQKATQQLLFDVDWRASENGPNLDVLVIDLPPGTGDVPLTLGQLVLVDGAIIVSSTQDVALTDVCKGITMFHKLSIPIFGTILNYANFKCNTCDTVHRLFGPPDAFHLTTERLGINVLGELPLVTGVSLGGDAGIPYQLFAKTQHQIDGGGLEWIEILESIALTTSLLLKF